jgi:hypothetical protein
MICICCGVVTGTALYVVKLQTKEIAKLLRKLNSKPVTGFHSGKKPEEATLLRVRVRDRRRIRPPARQA